MLARFASRVARSIARMTVERWGVAQLPAFRATIGAQLAAAAGLFRRIGPSVMVACEDGISTLLPVHAAARHLGIPVLEVPYGYAVQRDLEIALENKAARGELLRADGPAGRLLRKRAPQWIKQGPFEGAVMHLPSYIIAAESLGVTLRDAWIIHGGYADRLCVESEQMQAVYRAEGVPERKLTLTGTPYCDVMVRALEAAPAAGTALRQPRRIDPSRTRILVSWPPSDHEERAGHCEFRTYREMSATVLGWLNALADCEVTVSLHPAAPLADRQALADEGVRLTPDYVVSQIPQHDLFVTYFSSTIRWAVAAGKPVVNFDAYRLGLDVYAGAPGVFTVDSFDAFREVVAGLTASESRFAQAADRQIAVAPAWGLLDGQCTDRVVAEIARLASR
jgi:hypothetical protein